jgi:phosphatidylglycerol:prolipoprotein diacylglycerol transferase
MSFHFGPLTVNLYGFIIMMGAIGGAFLAQREARHRGQNAELVWDAFIWILLGGIIGARLWHILTPPPSMVARGITSSYYLTHPLDALAIWRGGLGIPGAILGGITTLYLFSRKRGVPFLLWADIAAPALAIGQAIGRWGNFVNQELYGAPADLPWAIFIDPQNRLPGFENLSTYHPLFLYESIWNIANALFLLWLGRHLSHKLKPGDIFLSYLIIYPLGRFLLEFLRLDSSQVAGLNINQTLMLIVGLLSGALLISRHLLKAHEERKSDTIHAN